MRMSLLLICAFFYSDLIFSQIQPEPTKCPWGCPTMEVRGSLHAAEREILNKVASKMKEFPDCAITIFYYSDTTRRSKLFKQKILERLKSYLVENKNLEPERITTVSKVKSGSDYIVDIKTDYQFDKAQAVTNECICNYSYPVISFKPDERTLNADIKKLLDVSAATLKLYPACNITVNTYSAARKNSQGLCDLRLNAIKRYFIEKAGISSDRIYTRNTVQGGDENTVDIKCDN